MKHCGMDVHLRSTTAQVLDPSTGVIESVTVRTHRRALTEWLEGAERMHVVLEASTASHWVADLVEELGHDVVVVDPNRTSAVAVAGGYKKTDALDASTLAWLSSKGAIVPSHRPSAEIRARKRVLRLRTRIVRSRGDLVRTVRSLLASQGFTLPQWRGLFTKRVRQLGAPIAGQFEAVLALIDAFEEKIRDIDRNLEHEAKEDPVVRRLMTVDGIGPVTATAFRVVIGEPHRFHDARSVAAYVGLVPAVYSSGDRERIGHITCRGDPLLRAYLVEAAHSLLNSCKKGSDLRDWALGLKARVGTKKAAVAVARKYCSIMWSMWMKETDFRRFQS
jgi:transposase